MSAIPFVHTEHSYMIQVKAQAHKRDGNFQRAGVCAQPAVDGTEARKAAGATGSCRRSDGKEM